MTKSWQEQKHENMKHKQFKWYLLLIFEAPGSMNTPGAPWYRPTFWGHFPCENRFRSFAHILHWSPFFRLDVWFMYSLLTSILCQAFPLHVSNSFLTTTWINLKGFAFFVSNPKVDHQFVYKQLSEHPKSRWPMDCELETWLWCSSGKLPKPSSKLLLWTFLLIFDEPSACKWM